MRRPLFAAAVLLVAATWIRLAAWPEAGAQAPAPGEQGAEQVPGRQEAGPAPPPDQSGTVSWYVTGQICQKEENKIWLQSIIINDTNPYRKKLICEPEEGSQDIPLGSWVALSGVFEPFSEAANPGEFDAASYYRSLGAGGRLKKASVLAKGEEYWSLREGLYQLKLRLKERILNVFPRREGTILCALLLGEKKDTDRELKELYKRNGILHILSISSLHITILGTSLYRLLRKTGLPVALCAAAGAVFLIFYGMMTGFSVSACRAIGMYLIRMLGEICGRTYDMLTALGILAAGMVLANPYYLQNTGFLLSFSAVLGIGTVYPALAPQEDPAAPKRYGEAKALSALRKLLQGWKMAALASLSVTLATLPVQLWFYYETPVFGVIINLLVLPFVKPMLITGFFSLAPGLGILSWVDRLILKWYEAACTVFDGIPFGSWNPGRPKVWQIAVYYGLLACALLLRRELARHKKRKPALPGVLLTAAVLILAARPAAENRVVFLDVGQGDACLVQTASGENYLFDCGSSSRRGVGQYVLLPALKYYGVSRLDAVFVSHPDGDHVSGVLELLSLAKDNRIGIGQVVLPAVEESARAEAFREVLSAAALWNGGSGSPAPGRGEGDVAVPKGDKVGGPGSGSGEGGVTVPKADGAGGLRVAWMGAGDAWECGEVRFLCLNPPRGFSAGEENAYSECVYVDFGSFTLLLTGDVEKEGEENLLEELQKRNIRGVTLLKAAHHGSRFTTSTELLEWLQPKAAVISCGRGNRYGHPHGELLERLEEAGSHILRTDLNGAVVIRESGGRVEAGGLLD